MSCIPLLQFVKGIGRLIRNPLQDSQEMDGTGLGHSGLQRKIEKTG